MKRIAKYVRNIAEELKDAECYAEKYIEAKADGKTEIADQYYDLSNDEMKHATIIHDMAVDEIDNLKKIFTPQAEMVEKWEKCHIEYVNKAAWIKQMLDM